MAGARRATAVTAPISRLRTRVLGAAAFLAVLAVGAGVAVPALLDPAGPLRTDRAQASDAASTLVGLLNQAREADGLSPLSTASDLTAVASERAQIMAQQGALSHTPDLGERLCCWSWLAENAAFAGSVRTVHSVLMSSAPHRANILYADADEVGVAVVRSDGQLWAAQVFRDRTGSTGDRESTADDPSRSSDRAPTTTSSSSSTSSSQSTSTGVAPSTASETPGVAAGPTRAELIRAEFRNRLQSARAHLQRVKDRSGPMDPVNAAVHYAGTLDAVAP